VTKPKCLTVFTPRNPAHTSGALRRLIELADEAGAEVRVPAEEVEKHGLEEMEGAALGADPAGPCDLAVALGGDGTILSALRRFAGREVPVFAINFGAICFLATVEHDDLDAGLGRALDGDFEVLALPALRFSSSEGEQLAVNDVALHRQAGGRVAQLEYRVQGAGLGPVRCDGLVAATAAGSTGYNLANGGPVMAWGVEGYVVSFIAPHTLTARPLVVAPDDVLEVVNRSSEETADVTTDGRPAGSVAPEGRIELRFERDQALLAQTAGATFYQRLRDKFGHLTF
jgi:NAD+ kinase